MLLRCARFVSPHFRTRKGRYTFPSAKFKRVTRKGDDSKYGRYKDPKKVDKAMDSKLHMIICEEFASSTKMFESQPRARKDWLEQHQKIKLKSGQAGLDYKDDDAT